VGAAAVDSPWWQSRGEERRERVEGGAHEAEWDWRARGEKRVDRTARGLLYDSGQGRWRVQIGGPLLLSICFCYTKFFRGIGLLLVFYDKFVPHEASMNLVFFASD
jgi:hypothetical protein